MCLNPNYVKRYFDDGTGELRLRFYNCYGDWSNDMIKNSIDIDNYFTLPCGKCAECNEQYSNEWAWRVMCESKMYKEKDCCFITLTYNDDNLPYITNDVGEVLPTLSKRDLQLFIKRLRKSIEPNKLRYFACGEYGSKGLRPHYHMILFGYVPDDLKWLRTTKKKQSIYSSDKLSKLWHSGFVSVGNLSDFSAKYCAKYMQKLNDLDDEIEQPFNLQSTKPGLGLEYFMEHKDTMLQTDEIYFKGKHQHIPRYFLRKVEKDYDLTELRNNRKIKAKLLYNDINIINHKYDALEVSKK